MTDETFKSAALARQALKAHAEKQHLLDLSEIEVVRKAAATGIPITEIAELLGISERTAYNRKAGKGPRAGIAWRT